ncbi:MAG: tetraacyldisaccharide 4'-kinase [Mangrovibacterium sp.]
MIKYLLYPFSVVYALITEIRNWLYHVGFFKSTRFDVPVIGVGNITVGGTGKTPHTEYLVRLLQKNYNVAVLSRGYGRKTTGFHWVKKSCTSEQVGDEPLQMKRKFGKVLFAVCESRVAGVKQILAKHPDVDLILLDDSFQHRAIDPSLKILLIDYNRLIMNDIVFPSGRMRELAYQHKRADIVIFTKCPFSLSGPDRAKLRIQLHKRPHQQIFFSCMDYGMPRKLDGKHTQTIALFSQAIMLTGIARPEPFQKYLEEHLFVVDVLKFPDHHNYTEEDVKLIEKVANKHPKTAIITTEKDAARLKSINFDPAIKERIFYVPIVVKFLAQEPGYHDINTNILNHVETYSRNSTVHSVEN